MKTVKRGKTTLESLKDEVKMYTKDAAAKVFNSLPDPEAVREQIENYMLETKPQREKYIEGLIDSAVRSYLTKDYNRPEAREILRDEIDRYLEQRRLENREIILQLIREEITREGIQRDRAKMAGAIMGIPNISRRLRKQAERVLNAALHPA